MSPAGGYGSHAMARWVAEPAKRAGPPGVLTRGPFVRDRARVLHSAALRRLAAKTQVVEVGVGDFPRTRLTHSLECAQIGREMGGALGCDPDLVDAACLAHDLGHPPFGHNGETALAALAAGCGGFEGNAQSLRLLTRLEAKVPGGGLNLTRATLDATIKYPWGRQDARNGKFGVYGADAEAFDWIRDGAPADRACLEAQVMDWADDVAYSVHDLEDGLHAGHISLGVLGDAAQRRAIAELTERTYCAPGSVTVNELAEVFDALLSLDFWPGEFDGGPGSLVALKHLTSNLIGRFCGAAMQATLEAYGAGPFARYSADLVVPRRVRLECALLKGVTAHYVMTRDGAAATQAREREIICELAAEVQAGAPGTLDLALRPAYLAAGSDADRLRVVIDQLASLTDTSAIAWHHRLCREKQVGAIKEGSSDAR